MTSTTSVQGTSTVQAPASNRAAAAALLSGAKANAGGSAEEAMILLAWGVALALVIATTSHH